MNVEPEQRPRQWIIGRPLAQMAGDVGQHLDLRFAWPTIPCFRFAAANSPARTASSASTRWAPCPASSSAFVEVGQLAGRTRPASPPAATGRTDGRRPRSRRRSGDRRAWPRICRVGDRRAGRRRGSKTAIRASAPPVRARHLRQRPGWRRGPRNLPLERMLRGSSRGEHAEQLAGQERAETGDPAVVHLHPFRMGAGQADDVSSDAEPIGGAGELVSSPRMTSGAGPWRCARPGTMRTSRSMPGTRMAPASTCVGPCRDSLTRAPRPTPPARRPCRKR